ncbi:hypothetical protein TW95_gp1502 [Pandoravirus inopinatum]|uniref:DUF5860 domain-containing protein n=1 Tax=Pandoravirus inopinatum TaxID=1605721 RepID=A0A0B5JB71_9VIRU|nr:hypothetical protein TW95_gp1502 [Pandoravirus inopinatum]AJF98236.1 hypothetical protein [Pandoravirus inopinatum]
MDAHIADTTKTETAAAIQPLVQSSTPDLWNMYPAIDRDDILKAIWIDGALKDVPHEWMPAGWLCKNVLTYSLTDDVESAKDFASRLSQFCKAHADISGVPCRVVLCVRRGPKRSELCYHVAVGPTESVTHDGATVDATGSVEAASAESASRAKSLDTETHIDDVTTAGVVTGSVRTGIAEVAAAFDTLHTVVSCEWVSDRTRINADCGHLIRAPAGPDGATLRRAIAEAISNHVYAVIGASGGRPHRLIIHGAASNDGKQIEFFYEILLVAAPCLGLQAPIATLCKADTPATDCPAPAAAGTITATHSEAAASKGQTAIEILALYPKLSMVQAADVLSAEIALGDVPHRWVKEDDTDTDATFLCSHDLLMDGLDGKVRACLGRGWQRVVLSVLQKESDRTIVTISGPRPSSSPKTQTIDDLLDLYPTLSAREAICLSKVVEGLAGIPTEWVDQDSSHTYDNGRAFGDASKMIAHVRRAFAKSTDETRPRHVVLTLHRDTTGLYCYFIILPTV